MGERFEWLEDPAIARLERDGAADAGAECVCPYCGTALYPGDYAYCSCGDYEIYACENCIDKFVTDAYNRRVIIDTLGQCDLIQI